MARGICHGHCTPMQPVFTSNKLLSLVVVPFIQQNNMYWYSSKIICSPYGNDLQWYCCSSNVPLFELPYFISRLVMRAELTSLQTYM